MGLPVLELGGTPRERGRKHGAAMRDAIQDRFWSILRARFPERDPMAVLDGLLPRIRAFEEATRPFAPHLLEEIHGIAAGAGLGFPHVFLLSAFEVFQGEPPESGSGCSAVAAAGEGRALVAQNWDSTAEQERYLVVLRAELPDGTRQLLLASAGGLGWLGMNSHGVGLVNNDLLLSRRRVAPPSQVIRRLVLERRTVADSPRVLRDVPSPAGRSYTLADRSGHLAVVEVSAARGPVVRQPERLAWHTNHVESPELAAEEDRAALDRTYPSSQARGSRAQALLAERPAGGPNDVGALLRDHEGFPLSVCKHESDREPSQTVASVIFDLAELIGWFAIGPPCSTDYAPVAC